MTQNGRLKWQNTKSAVPTLFPYPCSGDVLIVAGKKITAGHRPKTDQKAGMAVYLLNSPDIKPTRAREIELYLALFFCV